MAFGNTSGPIYPLGKFTVATAGTPILLSANVPLTDSTGTAANPAPIKCSQIKVNNTSATGILFLIFKGGTAAGASGTAVIVPIPALQERTIESPNGGMAFTVTGMALDTDTNGTSGYVTLIMSC
jgi:hypothetical protein